TAVIRQLVSVAAEQGGNLRLDGLRQQRSRAVAQNLGQRISKTSWLREFENVSVGHGVSLLRWRSGGVKHPHDTPPFPLCRHQLSPIALCASRPSLFTVQQHSRMPAGKLPLLLECAEEQVGIFFACSRDRGYMPATVALFYAMYGSIEVLLVLALGRFRDRL